MYSYDISMTNTYKPSFTADIQRTPWFNAGIKRAKELGYVLESEIKTGKIDIDQIKEKLDKFVDNK